jgi:copper resistance protein B
MRVLSSFVRAALTLPVIVAPSAFAQEHVHEVPAQAPILPSQRPWSQADAIHGQAAMDAARARALHEMGGMTQTFLMADRLEIQVDDDVETVLWDLQGWHGGDINRFWFKTEGHLDIDSGDVDEAEVQALWSRAISTYWDVQAGLRYDIEPDGLAHAVLGVQGLAPYMFEVDAAAFFSEDGNLTAHVEAEYELHFTQRLILQPRVEIGFAAQDIPERETGAGVSDISAGLRLRYEIAREFAPYVGVEWSRAYGDTADYATASGGDAETTRWFAGVRLWY